MLRRPLFALVLAATGCTQAAPFTPTDLPEAGITASATLDIRDPADRQVLSVPAGNEDPVPPPEPGTTEPDTTDGPTNPTTLAPWKKADIDHVKLNIYRGTDASAKATITVAKADLAKTVTFTNLVRSTTYRITATAWSDGAEASRIDNLANDASSCTKTFTTDAATLTYTLGTLPLKLMNKTFAGTTNGASIDVTDGAIADTTATETIRLNGAN